jgi:hypothetical protein
MQFDINHWHIVQSLEEMLAKAIAILNSPNTIYEPVLPFTAKESVERIIHLFNYRDSMSR